MLLTANANELLVDSVMEYLARRRMCSLGNLSRFFEVELNRIIDLASMLELEGRVRLVTSSCFGACGDCGGCDKTKTSSATRTLSDATIAISLEVDVNSGEAEE